MEPHEKALQLAKIEFMRRPDTVFYTTILFSLQQEWSTDVWAGATDGRVLRLNPEYFVKCTKGQRLTLLAHEILHVALYHFCRLGNRDHEIFNWAADYVINLLLVQAGYEPLTEWLYEEKYKDMDTETVYDLLVKNAIRIRIPGTGLDIIWVDDKDGKKESAVTDILIRAKIQSEAQGDKPGTIPGSIVFDLDELINPKLPWEHILQDTMDNFCKDDYSMQRPSRRFLPDNYMPSCYSEAVSNQVTAVDASCSVSIPQFGFFVSEHKALQERMKPEKITLITFDTKIKSVQTITQETDIFRDIKFEGRGGTNLTELMEWLDEHTPPVCIVFTDGGFTMPPKPKVTNIIWLIHNNPNWTAPYGRVIHYDI
jgi:predicted metal-dependent peptidase